MKLQRPGRESVTRLPFSTRAVTGLPPVFQNVVQQSLHVRGDRELSFHDVWESSFFSAYLVGFPSYLESYDERQMLFARKAIIESCFDENWGQVLARFKKTLALIKARRDGAFEGWRLGDIDGKMYFQSVANGGFAGDDSFTNLRMTVRRMENFTPL